jgi:predicted esterase
MLRLTRLLLGPRPAIASLQAPNAFYEGQDFQTAKSAYNWGIREDWDEAIRFHHQCVLEAIARLRDGSRQSGAPVVLCGFSQPVGLNYRFAATHPGAVQGVLALCGGVPRDWEQGGYHAVTAPILHIAREEDEFFPPETARGFPGRLRYHATDVEFHLIPGKHRFPSNAKPIVWPWLERKFGFQPG